MAQPDLMPLPDLLLLGPSLSPTSSNNDNKNGATSSAPLHTKKEVWVMLGIPSMACIFCLI